MMGLGRCLEEKGSAEDKVEEQHTAWIRAGEEAGQLGVILPAEEG
jgi:hypothetical protein